MKCGQERLRRNGVAITVNKGVRNAVLGCNLINDRMTFVCFQDKSFNIIVIQIYIPITNVYEAEIEWFYEDLQNLLELTPKKRCPFHYRGSNAKVGSQETWSNRQVWPWSTKWSRAKANRVLPRECTDHSKHLLSTTQVTALHMDTTRWKILKSDWLYSFSQRWKSSIQSAKTRLGADFGSDHELLIARFRLKI